MHKQSILAGVHRVLSNASCYAWGDWVGGTKTQRHDFQSCRCQPKDQNVILERRNSGNWPKSSIHIQKTRENIIYCMQGGISHDPCSWGNTSIQSPNETDHVLRNHGFKNNVLAIGTNHMIGTINHEVKHGRICTEKRPGGWSPQRT